jgi:ring-1,2-phenylacetyl-CoA epoxidase subunit PaaE
LVYGNRTHDTVIFKNQFAELQVKYPNIFTFWEFYTQSFIEPNLPFVVQGRIEPSKVLDVIQSERDIKNTLHYICGPTGLKESVRAALTNYGVPVSNVFFEDFELVKDEKDFLDIITQNVTIIKDGISHQVEVVKGKSILEAGLDALIEMPYSCQTGNCSICKGKLLSGSVKQILPKLGDLENDEYQLCCTYPLSKNVVTLI